MPSGLNSGKGNKIGVRQLQLARKWHAWGLPSDTGLAAVELAGRWAEIEKSQAKCSVSVFSLAFSPKTPKP
ncbi:hypothetical protein [Haloferula sp.]|uniref:hypothetical protein n=1 Tax=Haloferula sp. TaxID=2497595 RepID=UPI00329AAC41